MTRQSSGCLVLMLLAAAGGCVSAPTTGPGSVPDISDPGIDQGSIPNSIATVTPGRTFWEQSFEYDYGPEDGTNGSRLPFTVRHGVAEDVELRLWGAALQTSTDSSGTTTGAGPLQTGFKYRISRGRGRFLKPAWGLEVEFILPLSIGPYDDGKIEPGAWLAFDHSVGESGVLTWNAGFKSPVDEDGQQILQGYVAWAYAHSVASTLQLYATGSLNLPAGRRPERLSQFGVGGYWYFSQRTGLFAGYNRGVTDEAVDGLAILGIGTAF
jgi:hypothetical protein